MKLNNQSYLPNQSIQNNQKYTKLYAKYLNKNTNQVTNINSNFNLNSQIIGSNLLQISPNNIQINNLISFQQN